MLTGPKIPFFDAKNLSITSDSSSVSQSLPQQIVQQLEG